MESQQLHQWTLAVHAEAAALECHLSDGRRLDWRVQRPVRPGHLSPAPATAAALLGAELADRLASSAPRFLAVLYASTGPLDAVDWEHLDLGGCRLAEHFCMGRQLLSDADTPSPAGVALADELCTGLVCGAGFGARRWPTGHRVPFDALHQPAHRQALSSAHVLVLDGITLAAWLQNTRWLHGQRLLVVLGAQGLPGLASALDAGAAVLCLAPADASTDDTLAALLHQLGRGQSIGEAVRWLHRRADAARLQARLYGDPGLRFVRAQAPASRRQVTSLSFDLVGSTTLLAAVGDEAYAETLARVHARCTDIVRSHGGQADDPQGDDGVMSYFGHPAAIEDAAVRAVEAGLCIVQAVADLGVVVRVGIATGLVAIKAGQPVGLSVHQAARLQQVAEPGTVQVAHSTQQLIAHAFDLALRADGPLLKGIDPAEALYVVTGLRSDIQEHRLERASALTPMVGRQAELQRLHHCWRCVQAGGSRLVVVRAEAGVGKSRLVREFRHHLAEADTQVLECRCRPEASQSPFLTLAESLRRWLHIGAEESPMRAVQKLAAALPDHAREGEALELLADLLGLAGQPRLGASSGSRQRLLGLLMDWFHAFAQGKPCCLVVEDWHWVDPSLREFVEHLVAQPSGAGLLVVVTERAEVSRQTSFVNQPYECIDLPPLSPESARQLVAHVCAGAGMSTRLVAQLASRGDGVPLFLEEAARMALEQGWGVGSEESRWQASVPASLLDLLTARLDGLGVAKQVAQVAAVLGRQFSRAHLAELLDAAGYAADAGTLGAQLAVLMDAGLVCAEGQGRLVFRHALIRDAAYMSLWARDRQLLHGCIVSLLKSRWPDLVKQQPELLALHQTEAGLHADAWAQWELAASHAASRSAEVEAIGHLRHALAALAHTEPGARRDRTALRLQLLLAARLLATEGYGAEAVLQAYLEAKRMCDPIGEDAARFKVEMGLQAYRFMHADFERALEHSQQAAAIAARTGDVKQGLQAHWGQACTLFHQGRLRATMAEMDQVRALYRPDMHPQFGIQDPGVMCMAYSSWGLWELGRPDAALARINQAVDWATAHGQRFSQAVVLAYGVSVQLLRGDATAAMARAEVCVRVCEDSGFPVWLAITRCMRGYLLCERGEFDTGLRDMAAGHAQWLATGAMVSQPLYLALQIQGLMLAGQHGTAAQRLDEGLAIVHRYGERQLEAELTRLQGELALRRGDTDAAELGFKRAYALALRRHSLGFALRSATALARLWAATGREVQSRRLLVPLLARWHEGRDTHDVQAASAVLASVD